MIYIVLLAFGRFSTIGRLKLKCAIAWSTRNQCVRQETVSPDSHSERKICTYYCCWVDWYNIVFFPPFCCAAVSVCVLRVRVDIQHTPPTC